jgi:hypothetical protein
MLTIHTYITHLCSSFLLLKMFIVIEGDDTCECEQYGTKLLCALLEYGVEVACALPNDWYETKLIHVFKDDVRCRVNLQSLDFYDFEHRCEEQLKIHAGNEKPVSIIAVRFYSHQHTFRHRALKPDVVFYLRNPTVVKENTNMERFQKFATREALPHWIVHLDEQLQPSSVEIELFRVVLIHCPYEDVQWMHDTKSLLLDPPGTEEEEEKEEAPPFDTTIRDMEIVLTEHALAEDMRTFGRFEADGLRALILEGKSVVFEAQI